MTVKQIVLSIQVLLALPMTAAAANLGIIHGSVHEYGRKPIPNVRVTLLARGERPLDEHLTDDDGHFEFEQVPFGQYFLRLSAPDGRIDDRLIRVASGDVLTVDVLMPQLGEEIVVVAPIPKAPAPTQTSSSSSTLDREEIRSLPRGDTASVNEVLATQPGFVYDAFGNLFARGNHANIQYQLDGVPLPESVSGLFGGFLSPKFIENLEVITGGLPAEYGNRLAAIVNLNSRKPTPSGEGEVEVTYGAFQTFSPIALYGRRFGSLSILAGGSYRGTNRVLDPQAVNPIVHDKGDEERAFLRVDYDFSDHDHLFSINSISRNRYQIPIDPTLIPYDPTQPNGGRTLDSYGNPPPPFFPSDTDATETEHDFLSLLSYRHDFSPSRSLRASGYYRSSNGSFLGDPLHALGRSQDPCTVSEAGDLSCVSSSDVLRNRQAHHVGADADYMLRVGETHVFKLGGRVDQLFGSADYTLYTRSDVLQALDPERTVSGKDSGQATTGGAFIQDRASFGKFTLNAGIRFDFQKVSFSGSPDQATQTGFAPRLGIAYAFTPDIIAHAFAGLLWQPPPVLDTPAAARQLGVVTPDQSVTYDLRPEKDRYAEFGVAARIIPQLTVGLTLWGKLSTDQLDDIEVGSTNLLSPYNFRDGRAGGIEGSAVLVLSNRLNAFGNVTLQSAQGRGIATATYLFTPDALANEEWQTLDHSQTWTANTGMMLRFGPAQLSGLWAYGSGLRTGPGNNQHVPSHIRVDLTAAYHFREFPGRPLLALDVVNVFDNHYAYRIANGFNGSHWAPGRSVYARLATSF